MPSTKKLDYKYAKHLQELLKPYVDSFESQTAFAKHVKVSQPQISAIMKVGGGDRSVGISVLIRLRDYLGISLDEMLNLPKLKKRKTPLERGLKPTPKALPSSGPRLLPPAPPKEKRAQGE